MIEAMIVLAVVAKVVVELGIVCGMIYSFAHYGVESLLPWIVFFLGGIVVSMLNIEEFDSK